MRICIYYLSLFLSRLWSNRYSLPRPHPVDLYAHVHFTPNILVRTSRLILTELPYPLVIGSPHHERPLGRCLSSDLSCVLLQNYIYRCMTRVSLYNAFLIIFFRLYIILQLFIKSKFDTYSSRTAITHRFFSQGREIDSLRRRITRHVVAGPESL